MEIGEKVKELRQKKKMTLKELSDQTGISTGFLSQFERGLTTIDVDHLKTISNLFQVEMSYFFSEERTSSTIIRSYEQVVSKKLNNAVYKNLSQFDDFQMKAELVELLPSQTHEMPSPYTHGGEEFVYVLNGILTFILEDETFYLYPGDSCHFKSSRSHNWGNTTNEVVKILTFHYPNKKED